MNGVARCECYGKDVAATAAVDGFWREDRALRGEVAELIPVLRQLNGVLSEDHLLASDIPLTLHARYLGVELSAAFDDRTANGHLRDYYTGVELVNDRYDLLLVTLEKAPGVKEHLRYRDFPLNENTFHWQSKARTARDSAEGRRHLDPAVASVTPLLFVRERADHRPGSRWALLTSDQLRR